MGAKIPHMVALLSIIQHNQTAVLQPWSPLCGKVRCRTARVLPGSRGLGHRDSDRASAHLQHRRGSALMGGLPLLRCDFQTCCFRSGLYPKISKYELISWRVCVLGRG